MAILTCLSYRLVLLVLPLVLVMLAVPRLKSGVALEGAFPAPDYMTMNVNLPRDAYGAAAAALSHASVRDGESGILRGEAAILVETDPEEVEDLFRQNLAKVPASVRGWTLFAETLSTRDSRSASVALGHALVLGTLEYALIGRQTRLSASLWADLPESTHRIVLGQVERLWTEPGLRSELSTLLASQGGAELIARTFADTPQEHQAVIDWVQTYRRRISGQG